MVLLPNMDTDPTLELLFKIREEEHAKQLARGYLGASQIGEECERKLWYGYNGYPRPPMGIKGILATEEGHRTEDWMAAQLRLIPGIQLWTHNDEGGQYGFSKLDGKFKGHADGVILGLLQAPKTPHVWENKACAEKAFNAFKKCIDDYGSKNALENWNLTYFGQAQTMMKELQLERHYLTVCLSGGRDVISARTEYQPGKAKFLEEKAVRVTNATSPPSRISNNPSFFKCKFCDYNKEGNRICHDGSK